MIEPEEKRLEGREFIHATLDEIVRLAGNRKDALSMAATLLAMVICDSRLRQQSTMPTEDEREHDLGQVCQFIRHTWKNIEAYLNRSVM